MSKLRRRVPCRMDTANHFSYWEKVRPYSVYALQALGVVHAVDADHGEGHRMSEVVADQSNVCTDEDSFWKLIEELKKAVIFAETQRGGDGWHYDQAQIKVGFVEERLREWLECRK